MDDHELGGAQDSSDSPEPSDAPGAPPGPPDPPGGPDSAERADPPGPPDPPGSPDSPGSPDPSERPDRHATLRRIRNWTLVTVAAALIGALVTIVSDQLHGSFTNLSPIDVPGVSGDESSDGDTVYAPRAGSRRGSEPFRLYVAHPERLPESLKSIRTCDALRQVGIQAGGVDAPPYNYPGPIIVTVHGAAKGGVLIEDMHARILARGAPVPDGALLICQTPPPEPDITEAVTLEVDLHAGNEIQVKRDGFQGELGDPLVANGRSDKPAGLPTSRPLSYRQALTQFGQGFAIQLHENEFAQLSIQPIPGLEPVDWVVDAKVATSDGVQTVTLSDNGKPFHTSGFRSDDAFRIDYTVAAN